MVGLGITRLSMPAAGLLAVKAALAALDLPGLRDLLSALRRTGAGAASVREPIAAWAREHGVPV
jgi:phosphotransferase system enzyme I (PtsP)